MIPQKMLRFPKASFLPRNGNPSKKTDPTSKATQRASNFSISIFSSALKRGSPGAKSSCRAKNPVRFFWWVSLITSVKYCLHPNGKKKTLNKMLLQSWLDLTRNLCHDTVHLPQEFILGCCQISSDLSPTKPMWKNWCFSKVKPRKVILQNLTTYSPASKIPLHPSRKGHRCAVLR